MPHQRNPRCRPADTAAPVTIRPVTNTWPCLCGDTQLQLSHTRLYPSAAGEIPAWIYRCPNRACGQEAVAAREPGHPAPRMTWLQLNDEGGYGGRAATPAEAAQFGDVLAENTARDENGHHYVWMG